jgi:hypothetical protein
MVDTMHRHESGEVGLTLENWKYFADGKPAWRVGRLNSFPDGPEPAGVSIYVGMACVSVSLTA